MQVGDRSAPHRCQGSTGDAWQERRLGSTHVGMFWRMEMGTCVVVMGLGAAALLLQPCYCKAVLEEEPPVSKVMFQFLL